MSVAGIKPVHQGVAALLARVDDRKIADSSLGETAILNSLIGGNPGHEFATLIQKEVKNLFAVIGEFTSGALHAYSIPGFTVKSPPNLQPGYTGLSHDSPALQAGGAVLLKRKQIELGAIVQGPFTSTPFTLGIVFAINRGAGSRLDSLSRVAPASRPTPCDDGDRGTVWPEQLSHDHRPDDRL